MANKHWTKLPLVVAIAGAFVSPLSQAEESVTTDDVLVTAAHGREYVRVSHHAERN